MIEKHGNLFDTDANYIGHGVNCIGVMGAGIAKQFKDRYPRNFALYNEACFNKRLNPGDFMVVPEYEPQNHRTRLVVNFASQNLPGPDAQYKWLLMALGGFAREASDKTRAKMYGGLVAIPEIGCGIGGLEWNTVKECIRGIEYTYPDIEFEVWHYVG